MADAAASMNSFGDFASAFPESYIRRGINSEPRCEKDIN